MKQEENRPMDKLKSDYESIPVPTEAKERMLAGIAQAKKEQKGVIIMKLRSRQYSLDERRWNDDMDALMRFLWLVESALE